MLDYGTGIREHYGEAGDESFNLSYQPHADSHVGLEWTECIMSSTGLTRSLSGKVWGRQCFLAGLSNNVHGFPRVLFSFDACL